MSSYDKYLVGFDPKRFPVGAREVLIALGQSQYNEPVDQSCHFCAKPITVEPLSLSDGHPIAWRVSCPCGKCDTTFRGL
jgi:hypothetical protein